MMNIALFSTSNVRSGRSEELSRLLASIELVRQLGIDVELFLLLQGCSKQSEDSLLHFFPGWVEISATERKIPLSTARNIILNMKSAQDKLTATTIVAFPDDDCWYLPEVIQFIHKAFLRDDRLDFFFCRYGSDPCSVKGAIELRQPNMQEVISRASSNTIFLRGNLVKQLGRFEEDLGVGTSLNGGEDTEYAIRANLSSRKTLFADNAIVGHRDADAKIRAKYFAGSFVAISRNADKSVWVRLAVLRKLCAGLWLLIAGKLDFNTFKRALQG